MPMTRWLAWAAAAAAAVEAYDAPNIVMVLADDIGWSDFGYFGYDLQGATPTIDYLASQGVKLACVYGGTACTPGRAAFLTGRYPIRSGLQKGAIKATQRKGIFMDFTLVSDELKKAGYNTAMVGKWHVGCAAWEQTPTYRGFDTFAGFIANGQMSFETKKNDNYYDLYDDANYDTDAEHLSEDVRSSEIYDARAQDFIAAQTSSTPWFLYYALQDPHTPLSSPDYFLQEEPCSTISDSSRQVYCGMMRCIDTAVEGIMSAVSENGFLDNTLVIFSGDNGGAPKNGGYNWPMRGSKGTLFEGGIRQASFAWGAMLDESVWGTTYHGQLHLVDFFPTFLAVATGGLWKPPDGQVLDGMDVWEAISTGASSPRYETLLNCVDDAGGIRVGDYVLLYNQGEDGWYQQPDCPCDTSAASSTGTNSNSNTTRYSEYIAKNFPSPVAAAEHPVHPNGGGGGGGGGSTYQLFDVVNDPYQYNDLASSMTDIVADLHEKLQVYVSEQVDYNIDSDKENEASSMAAQTGYWGPWLGTNLPNSAASNIVEQE